MSQRDELEKAIAKLESQRAILGDAAVDAAIAGINSQLAALEPPPVPKEQRKQVTVLFADVSGFTGMSETMDAEDVQEIMNALWRQVDHCITDHNGHIDKHIGDAVMALWGRDEAREDDPEQAIKAALAMQLAVHTFAKKRNVPLKMRIGLNTGPVLLGEVGTTSEFTAMGDTVNTASRLEQAAPVSGILISHDTYRHVRGIFDVESQESLTVKGKSEPLQVYVVKQAKPRAFRMGTRGIEGIETKTIGRDDELQKLQTAYQTATHQRQTTVVTLVGEAGVGKSRLLHEFDKWIELRPERIRYFKGRASQQSQGIPHYLLRDMLAARFQILDSDPLAVVRQKFVTGLAEFLPDEAEMKAHILGTWLGYDFKDSSHLQLLKDDPEQIKNRATLYLAQFFTAIGERQPVVIFLEDIHWADGGSLDTVMDLARRRPHLPLLIVGLARPSLYQRRKQWGERIPAHTRLALSPLSVADTRDLVAELLRLIDPLPQLLHDLVSNHAEGNPFYAEELVKMLIDDGVIVSGTEAWQVVPEQLLELKVPATLTGVLQARLDRLGPDEKQALQQASVIGRIFWDQALAALPHKGHLALPALQAKEFIFPRVDTAFAGTAEYIFKHALLRDVTYETVLKRLRRKYHVLVAEWLVTAAEANGRSDEYAALIGEHYQLADKGALAAIWYGRAGQQAAATFAHEEAIRYLTLALQFTPDDDHAARFALLKTREKAYDMQGNREAQRQDIEQLVTLANRTSAVAQATVALRQANYAEVTSDYAQSIIHAQAVIELGHRGDDIRLVADGHRAWGNALRRLGKYPSAQEQFQTGLHLAKDVDDQKQVANCLNGMGLVVYSQGDYTTAKEYFEQALTIYREIGDRQNEGLSLNYLGIVGRNQGDHATAKEYYEQALAIRREIGDRWGEGQNLNNFGVVATDQGDYATARGYYEQALAIRREIGDRYGEASNLNNLGVMATRQGDYATAKEYLEQALTIYRKIGDRQDEGVALFNLGIVVRNQGDYVTAKGYLEQSTAIFREIGSRDMEGINLHEMGAVAFAQANVQLAESYYQQALTIRHELNQSHYSVEDWAGMAKLKLAQGDQESARGYGRQVLDYLKENPRLEGAENPMRAYCFTWEVLVALGQTAAANKVLALAAQVMQDYLGKNRDPVLEEMYLNQPHHQVLWRAWKENREV